MENDPARIDKSHNSFRYFMDEDQPELVIDAIQQVVAGVRDPTAWAP